MFLSNYYRSSPLIPDGDLRGDRPGSPTGPPTSIVASVLLSSRPSARRSGHYLRLTPEHLRSKCRMWCGRNVLSNVVPLYIQVGAVNAECPGGGEEEGGWRREVWWQAWGLLAGHSHCLRVLCLGVLVRTLAIGKVDAGDLDDGL